LRAIGLLWMVLLFVGLPAQAGARLILEDGQVLVGESVENKEGIYELELKTGSVIQVPVDLVVKVELTGDDAPQPTGLEPAQPVTLAGPPGAVEMPRRDEQLEVLNDSTASFRKSVIDPYWRPESDWDLDPAQNNFNPARWYQSPIDPNWIPRSGYSSSDDVTEFNPVHWYQSPIDPLWYPTDGFKWRQR